MQPLPLRLTHNPTPSPHAATVQMLDFDWLAPPGLHLCGCPKNIYTGGSKDYSIACQNHQILPPTSTCQ